MSDKKNEDYVVRMPESDDERSGEKDAFIARNNPLPPRPRSNTNISKSFSNLDNRPGISILAYCLSSISMTVVNKYVVSGSDWNLNFFYLAIQVWSSGFWRRPPPWLTTPRSVHRLHRRHPALQAARSDKEPSALRSREGKAM